MERVIVRRKLKNGLYVTYTLPVTRGVGGKFIPKPEQNSDIYAATLVGLVVALILISIGVSFGIIYVGAK